MLDQIDKNLLTKLQQDAQLTITQLGDALGLSASQAGRRRQRLEAEGYISGYRAHLAPKSVGLSVQAFIQVHLDRHGPDTAKAFARLTNAQRQITAAWTMTGDADYLLRVFAEDLSDLNRLIHDVLLPHPTVAHVHSQIVMDQLKADSALPV